MPEQATTVRWYQLDKWQRQCRNANSTCLDGTIAEICFVYGFAPLAGRNATVTTGTYQLDQEPLGYLNEPSCFMTGT